MENGKFYKVSMSPSAKQEDGIPRTLEPVVEIDATEMFKKPNRLKR